MSVIHAALRIASSPCADWFHCSWANGHARITTQGSVMPDPPEVSVQPTAYKVPLGPVSILTTAKADIPDA